MELKDFFEEITTDLLVEGIAAIFMIGVMLDVFFSSGVLSRLVEIYVASICGG